MVASVRPAEFVLSDEERDRLVSWSRESSRLGTRARIVLACAEPGSVYARIAADLGGSSWINQVERWFGFLTDHLLRRGVHTSVQALEADVRE